MKDLINRTGSSRIAMVVLSAACLMFGLLSPVAAAMSVPEILDKCDQAEGYNSSYGEMQQIITTSSGQKRTLVLRSWGVNNGDKQLSEYLAPADVKGQKMLMTDDGDNIWMFNPETRRTRKLGSHMKKKKVMGSDFTYEDQSGGKISEKYTGKLLREEKQGGVETYVLELTPTDKGPSYDKIIAWIGKSDYIVRRIDFFEDGGDGPFKRLIMENIKAAGKKMLAHKMTMTNLEDKTETVNIITRIQFGAKIPDSVFESRNLQK